MQYEALFVAPGSTPFPISILDEPHIRKYYIEWGRRGDQAFIAQNEKQPVGAVWSRIFPKTEPGYGFVAEDVPELSMALVASSRGQGVGTRLLNSMIQELKKHHRGVSLSVDRSNPAFRLYQRMGFHVVKAEGNPTMVQWF